MSFHGTRIIGVAPDDAAACIRPMALSRSPGAVLVIHDDRVVAGVGDDLGGDGAAHREPGPERGLAREHLPLAAVLDGHARRLPVM